MLYTFSNPLFFLAIRTYIFTYGKVLINAVSWSWPWYLWLQLLIGFPGCDLRRTQPDPTSLKNAAKAGRLFRGTTVVGHLSETLRPGRYEREHLDTASGCQLSGCNQSNGASKNVRIQWINAILHSIITLLRYCRHCLYYTRFKGL